MFEDVTNLPWIEIRSRESSNHRRHGCHRVTAPLIKPNYTPDTPPVTLTVITVLIAFLRINLLNSAAMDARLCFYNLIQFTLDSTMHRST